MEGGEVLWKIMWSNMGTFIFCCLPVWDHSGVSYLLGFLLVFHRDMWYILVYTCIKSIDFDDFLVEVPYGVTHENQSKKFVFADLEV